jgi:uncharacterized protein YjbI with pentapeptide repeats
MEHVCDFRSSTSHAVQAGTWTRTDADFSLANFTDADIGFKGARFSGGTVDFSLAQFLLRQ